MLLLNLNVVWVQWIDCYFAAYLRKLSNEFITSLYTGRMLYNWFLHYLMILQRLQRI